MKKPLLFIFTMLCAGVSAQEHFSGISTSRRVGILNATVNPAELVNLSNTYEVNVFAVSANAANNKVTFSDLVSGGDDFDDKIFSGSEAVNLSGDAEILGPSFAFKWEKWAFAVSTAAKIKANVVDFDVNFGNALTDNIDFATGTAVINARYNQRVSATTWGEVGFSAAREIYNNDEHSISGGVTFKLIFPGSYANLSTDSFTGRASVSSNVGNPTTLGDVYLHNTNANLNIAYSGSLADDYTDVGNYMNFFEGGLNGFATDIGINYRWKDTNDTTGTGYRINAGLALKNMGSMTFKDDNNVSNNYALNVPDFDDNSGQGLNLSQFDDADDIEEIEEILVESGYVTLTNPGNNFKVKLPATFSAYADVKVYNNWYATAFLQQRLNEPGDNEQVAAQNIFTVTPRYSTGFFEAYMPFSSNEISGFTTGIGFRIGGFFVGSGSIISAAISDTEQADAYIGFRYGF